MNKNTAFRLLCHATAYYFNSIILLFSIIFLIFAELANGWFFKEFFDALVSFDRKKTIFVLIIGIIINSSMSIFFFLHQFLSDKLSEKIGMRLRILLFNKIQALPLSLLHNTQDDMLFRFTYDINEAKNGISLYLVQLIYGPLLAISVLIYMFFYNVKLAMLCGLVAPVFIITSKFIGSGSQALL